MLHKKIATIMVPITKLTKETKIVDRGVLESLGVDHTKIYWNTNIDITKLEGGVLCSYRCIITNYTSYVASKFNKEEWLIGGICF